MQADPAEHAAARRFWAVLAALLPLLAVAGVFTTTRLFFVRDLAAYFWPHHLWLRQTLWSGESPLWDPNPGLGYAAAADPAVQVFFLPTLPFRLLLPAVVGFNVSVALPFPLAALGMFAFLRRGLSAPAACLGGLAYALSGPILSTGNCTNLAWCSALLPWTLLSVDRLAGGFSPRWFALLATLLAFSLLAGEPVTWAGTVALGLAYALLGDTGQGSVRARIRTVALVGLGVIVALGLSAVQVLPLLDVTKRSIRGAEWLAGSWSFSPARLFETLSPALFGDYLGRPADLGPWLAPVNDGREPYLVSLYLGVALVLLAVQGLAAGKARAAVAFWTAAGGAALLWALGTHTPLYPTLLYLAPALRTLRYPVKFTVFAACAVAVLAAYGWESLREGRRRSFPLALGGSIVVVAAMALVLGSLFPGAAHGLAQKAAAATGLPDPAAGAAFFAPRLPLQAARLLGLAAVACACLWVASADRPEAPLARYALLVLVLADLLAANAHLNPTIPASALDEPKWIAATRAHPEDRVFITQNFSSAPDPDFPRWGFPGNRAVVEVLADWYVALPPFPTAWGVREALAQELTGLRPREYLDLLERYRNSDRPSRTRALRRLGVRYFVLPGPPSAQARRLEELAGLPPLALYEDAGDPLPRAWVVPEMRVEPEVSAAVGRIFDADFDPRREVLVDRDSAPAGEAGEGAEARASVARETHTRVEVDALVPTGGGFLVLSDAFDPNWRASVDGRPAPVLRANGLLRAVRLSPGPHRVVFTYRPVAFYAGAALSVLTAALLLGLAFSGPSKDLPKA